MQLDQKVFEGKVGSKWYKYLQKFFESKQAYDIYQVLKNDRDTDYIVPKAADTWKFLKNIDPDNVKVVFILLDSYPGCYVKPTKYTEGIYHANGLPLDCSNSPDGKLQPSFTEFWNGLSAEFGEELPKEKSVQFLLDQGLFLGNRGITCKMFKTESHIPMWDYFWQVFFEEFISKNPNIPIIFGGKEAQKLKKFVAFNPIYNIAHPSFAARTGQTWNTENVFTKCNKRIADLNGPEFQIEYNYKTYLQKITKDKPVSEMTDREVMDLVDELPF